MSTRPTESAPSPLGPEDVLRPRPRFRLFAWLAALLVVGAGAFAASTAGSFARGTDSEVIPAPALHPLLPVPRGRSPGAFDSLVPDSALPSRKLPPSTSGPRTTLGMPAPDTCVLQTPLSESELLDVLWDGHVAWAGKPPPPQRLACAFAHCALEHGRGKRLFGNNLGHVTTAGGWAGRSCLHSWTERSGTDPDTWKVIRLEFRMHDSLEEGATDYWKLMGSQYRVALDACDAGDAEKAGLILGDLGYYTSAAASYATAMKGLFVAARKRIKSESGAALRP